MRRHFISFRRCATAAAFAAATFVAGCVVAPAGYYEVGEATYAGPGYGPAYGGYYTAIWPATLSLGFYGGRGSARWYGGHPWGYNPGWRGHGWRGHGWRGGLGWHGHGGWGRLGGFHGGRR